MVTDQWDCFISSTNKMIYYVLYVTVSKKRYIFLQQIKIELLSLAIAHNFSCNIPLIYSSAFAELLALLYL